jgi:hypothetical protein
MYACVYPLCVVRNGFRKHTNRNTHTGIMTMADLFYTIYQVYIRKTHTETHTHTHKHHDYGRLVLNDYIVCARVIYTCIRVCARHIYACVRVIYTRVRASYIRVCARDIYVCALVEGIMTMTDLFYTIDVCVCVYIYIYIYIYDIHTYHTYTHNLYVQLLTFIGEFGCECELECVCARALRVCDYPRIPTTQFHIYLYKNT